MTARLPLEAPPAAACRAFAAGIARLAVRSLHAELVLYPKPGLVSLVDNGSHDDMDATTFLRSLFSLRHYFRRICLAGMRDAPFAVLRQLGIEAEQRMLKATGGINTHRGAIFSLGLICAAAGHARAQQHPLTPASLRAALLIRWGAELDQHAIPPRINAVSSSGSGSDGNAPSRAHGAAGSNSGRAGAPPSALSHGLRVAEKYAASGAREEGALGLPSVFEIGLPALQAALTRGAGQQSARVDALFALMAHVSDTNVYHRAGPEGARFVSDSARSFLAAGGTAHPGWRDTALACHHEFVRRRLSPGGAADLLAASCLVQAIAVHLPAELPCPRNPLRRSAGHVPARILKAATP
jgi:triphosphoribosyl-dephospho-CoA synthase